MKIILGILIFIWIVSLYDDSIDVGDDYGYDDGYDNYDCID